MDSPAFKYRVALPPCYVRSLFSQVLTLLDKAGLGD